MLDVTVKTLDGKNYKFSVPDDITVSEFKTKIAGSVNIPAESQRLIFIGRVLQDEKKLDDYDVNGKTIHLVQRPPPSATARTTSSATPTQGTTTSSGQAEGFVFNSFTMPSEPVNAQQIQAMVQQAIGNMGEIGRNAQVSARTSDDGSLTDVLINLGNIGAPAVHESQAEQRLANARRMISNANAVLNRLENQQAENADPMDTAGDSTAEEEATDASNESTSESQNQNQNGADRPRSSPITSLAPLLDEVMTLNSRLQPYLVQYQSLMRDDPAFQSQDPEIQRRQRLCNLVSEILHDISHAYHSISDLMVDMAREPPRQLYAVPTPVPRVIQQTATIPVSVNARAARPAPAPSATPSSTASATQTQTTNPTPQRPVFMMSGPPMGFLFSPRTGQTRPAAATNPSAARPAPPPSTSGPVPTPNSSSRPSAPRGPPPMMMGGMPMRMPGMRPVDACLPCNSRHFLLRRANQATNSTSQQQGAPIPVPDMTQIIQTVMGSIVSQGVPMQAAAPAGQPASNAAPRQNPAMEQLRQMLSQANRGNAAPAQTSTPATSTTTTTNTSSSTAAQSNPRNEGSSSNSNPNPLTDEVFTQLVSGIGSFMSNAAMGQPSNQTLADFLGQLGQDPGSGSNDGLMAEIFNAVSTQLTFIDLLTIFLGNAAPLMQARESLQTFVRERVLNNQTNTPANLAEGIDRLMREVEAENSIVTSDVRTKEDIDFSATLLSFIRHHLTLLCQRILRSDQNDTAFPTEIVASVRRAFHEFIVLSRSCLDGDVPALDALIQSQVRSLTGEVNPLIQQWMISNSSQQLHSVLHTINITPNEVAHFIVRRGAASPQASSEGSYMSAESGEDVQRETESMEVDSNPTGARPPSQRPVLDAALLSRLPLPPRRDELDVGMENVDRAADWHRVLPSEWVPVISRDVVRQQRETAQPPFSDAYLNGMPAKRRKVMQHSQQDPRHNNLPSILPDALLRAATEAGAEPVTSLEDMAKEAATSSELTSAFESQISRTISDRVRKDPDYIAEKYPNSEKAYRGDRS